MAYKKRGSSGDNSNFEVATERADGSVKESFGGKPPKIAVGGGTMCTFGHKPNAGVWPKAEHSVDQKTGFPEGFDKPKKGPRP